MADKTTLMSANFHPADYYQGPTNKKEKSEATNIKTKKDEAKLREKENEMSDSLKVKQLGSSKASERFVPWEPYRGAIERLDKNTPLAPNQKKVAPESSNGPKIPYKVKKPVRNTSKKHLDCENWQKNQEFPQTLFVSEDKEIGGNVGAERNYQIENILKEKNQAWILCRSLKAELDYYKAQVDYQSQVNGELKKLLVASMGDDLQLHLEGLSQDKARLAQNIVTYSRELSQEHENIEKLAIDSDVWRSKFLACSVMVDELVGWRLYLIRQFENAQKCMAEMLQEHDIFRHQLLQTLIHMKEISSALHPSDSNISLKTQNCYNLCDLVEAVNDMGKSLHERLLIGRKNQITPGTEPPMQLSRSEKNAFELVKIDTSKLYGSSPCDQHEKLALEKRTKLMAMSGLNCNIRNLTVNCCKNCYGEIKAV